MALAKQFYSSFKSYNGWDYYLEIWVEGYDGSASEITLGAGGPVITYGTDEQDRFSSILSSKLELPFMVTNTTEDAFVKNIREQFNEQDVYIHLYRESSSGYSSVAPLWSGFVLMDLSASPDLYYPYPVTLTAVDGLSLLKEIDFVQSGTAGSYTDSDMYSSNGRFTYWIKEILLKSGASTTAEGSTQDYKFTTGINWFNSVMPTITQSTDPFYQTKCNTQMFFSKDSNDNFTVVNCYDVLKNLLKHWGARIIYWKHIYYIVQIQEYNTAESGTYANPDNIDTRTYTKTGAFDSSSDNLGDSYWTRYNLLIDEVTGGIQKLTGTQFNYLPQLKRTQANFIDYGNKNYYGGLPFDLTTGQTDVIKQATISDVSTDGTMILIIPLDVTMVTQYQGVLQMLLYFRLYITDGVTTYYLRYDPSNTPKYYWEDSSSINLNFKKTIWKAKLDNIVGTQTKVGFHQQIDFKDVNGSALTLNGEWDVFTDIDNWGSNNGSFIFKYAITGPFTYTPVYTPSASTIYWTNTLNPAYQSPLNLSIIGTTTQQSYNPNYYNNIGSQNNNIVTYTTSLNQNPFEGKLLIVNTSSSGALYGSFVSVSPSPTTNDSQIVDFGELIWGDTLLASSEGSLKVWNGSSFVKSNVIGTWGLGSTSGTNSFTEMLLSEYLYGQTKVIESPSMRLVIGETNKNQNDGSGSRPNYVNPIGRLKGYSATGTTPYYIFKSGSFHLLKDEIDYQAYQIIRDSQTLTKTDDVIIGPDILQDKTNIIGQKTPQTNSLINKVAQNSFITTTSALKSAYGNDIAVNGIFASDTGWTKGTGWSIASNKASFSPTGSTSDIKQDTLTNALTYKIVVSLTLSAGALSVKAGSSGNATVLSSSGTYEIFSTCAGSTEVIFQASAAFEGYIEKVVVQQQVPVTSISINAIGEAVFKTNDVLNIADIDGSDVNQFTVSSNQGASDTSISVTSKLITEDILEGSIILVNQNDLAAQYQNKTKGTVGGFTIDADGIAKGGVEITGWLDSDTMSGATANNVPTAESVKAYVDAQVGSADTLAEVLANGNTTGGTDIVVNDNDKINFGAGNDLQIFHDSNNSYIKDEGTGDLYIQGSDDIYITAANGEKFITCNTNDSVEIRYDNSIKLATTNTGISITGGGVFTGQVTIPATPVAATDAASKSYVDAQVGTADTLQEVTDNGAITTNDMTISNGAPSMILKDSTSSSNTVIARNSFLDYVNTEVGTVGFLGDGDLRLTNALSKNITFYTNNAEKMRLTSDGKLGLGTSSPSVALEIGTNNNVENRLKIHSDKDAAYLELQSLGNVARIEATNGTNLLIQSSGPSGYVTFNTAGSERMRLWSSGNLLINRTSDAGSRVQVDGEIRVYNANYDVNSDGYGYRFGAGDCGIFHTGYNMTFKNYNGSSLAENMRLLSNGHLLLGTTVDSGYELDVTGTFRVTGLSYFNTQINANYGVKFTNGDTDFLLYNNSGEDVLYMRDTTNGAMITTWGVNNFTVNKDLKINDNTNFIAGTGDDFKIHHDGVNSYIRNFTGDLYIRNTVDDKDIIFESDDGSGGTTPYITLDGSVGYTVANKAIRFNDSVTARFGTGSDFTIQHDGTATYLNNNTGNLVLTNLTDDGDIVFKSDDGSGGTEVYFRLDGSQTTINLEKTVLIGTTTNTGSYKIDVAGKQRVQDTLELDDVLMLNAISTPSDPAAGKSVIYMDSSDGGIKCKINVGGTTVTRTLASFE